MVIIDKFGPLYWKRLSVTTYLAYCKKVGLDYMFLQLSITCYILVKFMSSMVCKFFWFYVKCHLRRKKVKPKKVYLLTKKNLQRMKKNLIPLIVKFYCKKSRLWLAIAISYSFWSKGYFFYIRQSFLVLCGMKTKVYVDWVDVSSKFFWACFKPVIHFLDHITRFLANCFSKVLSKEHTLDACLLQN